MLRGSHFSARTRMRILVLLLFLLTPGLALSAGGLFGGGSQGDFLPVDEAFALTVSRQENGATLLHWRIAPGYYLYQQRLQFDGLPPERQPPLPEGSPTATSSSATRRSTATVSNCLSRRAWKTTCVLAGRAAPMPGSAIHRRPVKFR